MTRREQKPLTTITGLLPVLAAALAVGSHGSARAAERYTLDGERIAIYNLAGELRVEAGAGPGTAIEVTRAGKDAASLRVETGAIGGRQTLRVIYPGRRVVYSQLGRGSNSSTSVRSDGTFGDQSLKLLGRRVTVAGSGPGTDAHADLLVRVPRGRDVSIYLVAGKAEADGAEADLRIHDAAGPVSVRGIRGDLVLDTGSGRVVVSDVEGAIVLDTGSGDVTVTGVRGSRLAIDTGSGGVSVTRAEVDDLIADTGSGGVTLTRVRSRTVRVDTGSGQVEVELESDCESVVVDTGSGGVTLRVPAGLGADFDIDTGSGSIDVDVPHQASHIERDHVRGRIGDGRGTIRIDTGSGGVQILRAERAD